MMKKTLLLNLLFIIAPLVVFTQRSYITTDSEMIFSTAQVSLGGNELDTELRWTVYYHSGTYNNHDISDNFGLFYGLAIRNVGFITQKEVIGLNLFTTVKRRSYTLGFPVGIKLGNLTDNMFIFGGGEYEWLFHYKEKWFEGRDKVYRETDWFSRKTNTFIPSIFAGINFRTGITVTFKYYLEDFMNRSYRDPLSGLRPYSGMESKIFYVSLSKKFRYDRIKDTFRGQVLSI